MLLPESKNKSQKYGCRMLFHSHCVFKDGLALSECLVSNSQFPVVQNLFNFVYLLPLTYSPSSSGTKKNRTSSKIEQNKKMPQQFIKNIKQQLYHSTIAVKAYFGCFSENQFHSSDSESQ